MKGVYLDGKKDKSAKLWTQGDYPQTPVKTHSVHISKTEFVTKEPRGGTWDSWDEWALCAVLYFSGLLHPAVLVYFTFSCNYLQVVWTLLMFHPYPLYQLIYSSSYRECWLLTTHSCPSLWRIAWSNGNHLIHKVKHLADSPLAVFSQWVASTGVQKSRPLTSKSDQPWAIVHVSEHTIGSDWEYIIA